MRGNNIPKILEEEPIMRGGSCCLLLYSCIKLLDFFFVKNFVSLYVRWGASVPQGTFSLCKKKNFFFLESPKILYTEGGEIIEAHGESDFLGYLIWRWG